ncbi:MAG: hypothetical protein MK212_13410 [Saprospiraceae bacterium]|nr:hypothetical protein [Saprospiraceae bacterium]
MKQAHFVFTVLSFSVFTLLSQGSLAQTSKAEVITIKSSDDLKALEDVYQQKLADQLHTQQTTEEQSEKMLKAMEEAYNSEIQELDALEQEQEALVNWYFSQPVDASLTKNTLKLTKKNK